MAFAYCRAGVFCPVVHTSAVLLAPSPRRNGGIGNTFPVPSFHGGGFVATNSGVEQLCLDTRPDRPDGALEGNVRDFPSLSGGRTLPARLAERRVEAHAGVDRRRVRGGGGRDGLRRSQIPAFYRPAGGKFDLCSGFT